MILPSVSIIVPAYNASDIIKTCIEALLAIEYPKDKLEIIVVDNNSGDETRSLIEKYPVILETETKIQSSYAARNRGILRATGEIIAFTDSDCIVEPQWIKEGVKFFVDKNCGAVAGEIISSPPTTLIEEYLKSRYFLSQKHTLNHSFYPYPQTANAFYRRSVLETIGFFDPQMVSGGDADISWRMQMQTGYRLCHAPDAIIQHKHRNTIKGFYEQNRTYGIGRFDLETKYEKEMRAKGILLRKDEHFIISLIRFFLYIGYIFIKGISELVRFHPRRSFDGLYRFIGFLGLFAGQKDAKKKIS